MEQEPRPVNFQDSFHFTCSPGISCFNHCCRDLNQFLYPYDLLRLKNHFGMRSDEFLSRYTIRFTGPETGLEVVSFKGIYHGVCPFLDETGCTVYADRPAACRTYPLARLLTRNRETGDLNAQYYVLEEDHCRGFGKGEEKTLETWILSQEIDEYNAVNDRFIEIISLKSQKHPAPFSIADKEMLFLATYDLDNFRDKLFSGSLPTGKSSESFDAQSLKTDDKALLLFAHEWIKNTIFHE